MRRSSETGLFQSKMMGNHIVGTKLVHFSGPEVERLVHDGGHRLQGVVSPCAAEPNRAIFNPPVSLPRLVDMDWRVDIKTSSDSIVRMAVPTCLLQLKVMAVAVKDPNNKVQHLTYQGKPVQTSGACLVPGGPLDFLRDDTWNATEHGNSVSDESSLAQKFCVHEDVRSHHVCS